MRKKECFRRKAFAYHSPRLESTIVVIVGGLIGGVFVRKHKQSQRVRSRTIMTAEEKILAAAQALAAERSESATPNQDFIRDWAYGNAGLEDKSIAARILSANVLR